MFLGAKPLCKVRYKLKAFAESSLICVPVKVPLTENIILQAGACSIAGALAKG